MKSRAATGDRRGVRSAIEEVGRHEEVERDLRRDLELRDLRRRVRVAHFVLHVLDHADQRVRPASQNRNQQARLSKVATFQKSLTLVSQTRANDHEYISLWQMVKYYVLILLCMNTQIESKFYILDIHEVDFIGLVLLELPYTVHETQRTPLFWVNLNMSCIIILIMFVPASILTPNVSNVKQCSRSQRVHFTKIVLFVRAKIPSSHK